MSLRRLRTHITSGINLQSSLHKDGEQIELAVHVWLMSEKKQHITIANVDSMTITWNLLLDQQSWNDRVVFSIFLEKCGTTESR